MISCHDIVLKKDGKTLLSNISLTLTAKRIGIIGHNGSGKTSFSKLLNGLETPTSGEITIFDSQGGSLPRQQHMGFVFQNPDNQIIFPIVEEDLAFGLKNSGLTKEQISQRVSQFLGQFGLEHLQKCLTHQLSGGEKQLIALLGVLIMQPDYIILDEPTTLLDLKNRGRLIHLLAGLEQTLIIVSHDLGLISEMEQVILFHQGEVMGVGSPLDMIAKYKEISLC
ncbi:energy-coupling factor ABC transporter ATP-binding protein (plasmid) [Vibrio sp. SS-MA-C1-2]|uniref:energy-coupling factor ABC transporter ATP-binding protein n=1 Tax=Vibrio sp. SS-MA-C1-2 TaxID=2908646 RepID=UPI001F2B2032|nr:ABC transporter ATP-binding protein [Vibrio sp. SS-MA-C1-2]UJF20304.1 energy-coupling factor ABC transporter ATP-binding protein [Vibrio sp. SS-MA-C1-2]